MIVFSMLMLFLGFLGLITGIVLIIIKKTRKSGIYTTVASVACGIIFSIVFVVGVINEGAKAIDNSSTDTSNSAADTSTGENATDTDDYYTDPDYGDEYESAQENPPSENFSNDNENDDTDIDESLDSSDITPETVVSVLQESYGDIATVDYSKSDKTFIVLANDEKFNDAIDLMRTGQLDLKQWETLKKAFETLSKSIYKNLGDGYSLQLQSEAYDIPLLTYQDGELAFDSLAK